MTVLYHAFNGYSSESVWLEQEPIPVFLSQIAKIKNQAKECPLWCSDLGPLIQLFAVLLRFIGIPDHYTFLGNCPPTPPLSQQFALREK